MHHVDLLIIGAGLSGCIAADEAVRRGLSVALIEPRSYPGYEISAYGHTFLPAPPDDDSLRRCPPIVQPLFQLRSGDEIVAPEGLVRQHLLSALEERGVPVLYEAEPVAMSTSRGSCTGVLFACPSGLVWVSCAAVLETRASGAFQDDPSSPTSHTTHATFEMVLPRLSGGEGVESIREEIGAVVSGAVSGLDLMPESVRVHPSLRADAIVVEYGFAEKLASPDDRPGREPRQVSRYAVTSRIELEARRRSVALAAWLRDHVPAFDGAVLSRLADECHITFEWKHSIAETERSTAFDLVVTLPRLPWGFTLEDVADTARTARSVVDGIVTTIANTPGRSSPGAAETGPVALLRSGELSGPGIGVPMGSLFFELLDDEALPVRLYRCTSPEVLDPPVASQVEVCVAGVGTAGGMAMLAAAESGCRVSVVEVNRAFGGTHTVGGVAGYYDGYREGAAGRVARESSADLASAVGSSSPGGIAHAGYLGTVATERGVEVFTGTRVCGAVCARDDARPVGVTGIMAANEAGLFAINARVTIDATGDAAVAALAGAEYRIGDDRDGMVQSFSMWGTEPIGMPGFLLQRYLTDLGIYHPDVYSERLRAISIGHRSNSIYHMSPMVTPRESRRIVGEYSLSLDDVLSGRTWPDVIAVARTCADSHAFTSSDLDRIGPIGAGIPIDVRIPYRCFVPKGIDGLLVAGKAISGERDATSFCRMNADVKNAGYAVGLAAARTVSESVPIRDIDIASLQQKLGDTGVLPEWAFTEPLRRPADLSELVSRLETGGFVALRELLQLPLSPVREALERRHAEIRGSDDSEADSADSAYYRSPCALVCMALAWHGSPHGSEMLASLLERAVEEGRHTTPPHRRTYRTALVRGDGDDDYSLVNRLLVFAGRSPSPEVIPPLARLVGGTSGPGDPFPLATPYDRGREDIVAEPFYHRLRGIAFAVERKADSRLVRPMELLLARPGMTGYTVRFDSTTAGAHGQGGKPRFMLAHLEIQLARAAARCGSLVGTRILVAYLADTHVFFRRHAREELVTVAGNDYGAAAEWERWLEASPDLRPVPFGVG